MIHTHQGISAIGAFKTKALQVKISKAQPGLNLLSAVNLFTFPTLMMHSQRQKQTTLITYCLTHPCCRLTQHNLVLLLFLD